MTHPAAWGRAKSAGRRRHEAGRMNGLEADYAGYLGMLKAAGEIEHFDFEAVRLRLADKTWYLPDFFVQLTDGTMEFHETKGRWEDDALVKHKVAAEQHSWARFVAIRRLPGGCWKKEYAFIEDREA